MNCNCFRNPYAHRVLQSGTTVTSTGVNLAVTFSTNIADHELFKLYANSNAINLQPVTGAPVPVTININGNADVQLWNQFGEQILSSQIPDEAAGFVSLNSPTPHVILIDTPKRLLRRNYV